MENCTLLRCMMRDKLFISVERVDYDCFIATGKYISAECDKNGELHETDRKRSPEQSFRSTVVLQANMESHRNMNESRRRGHHDPLQLHVDDDDNVDHSDPDREDRPFMHLGAVGGHSHDSDISASPAVIRDSSDSHMPSVQTSSDYFKYQTSLNMPVNRKRG